MRSNEERTAVVKRRIAELEKQRRLRRGRAIARGSIAAGLVLVVGLAVLMPDFIQNTPADGYDGLEAAGSMFGGNEAIGYIVIGLFSFVLGACVTVLCFRIRALHREEREEDQENSDGGAG